MNRTIFDHKKQAHTLDLDTVLVDGVRCLSVQATDQYVQFELQTSEAVTCELAQFWREVTGPDLSAQEAGLLLAECLMRQVVLQLMSSSLHEAISLLTRATALPAEIPSFQWLTTRLDPLARQAMSAYDGSDAMTDMLARILHQSPATIQMWAHQLGLDVAPAPAPASEAGAGETLAEAEAHERFSWSAERTQQLEQALAHCPASTVTERARQIAAEYGWPEASVRSKLYELQRPRRAGQSAAREVESAEPEKEDDQRVEQLATV